MSRCDEGYCVHQHFRDSRAHLLPLSSPYHHPSVSQCSYKSFIVSLYIRFGLVGVQPQHRSLLFRMCIHALFSPRWVVSMLPLSTELSLAYSYLYFIVCSTLNYFRYYSYNGKWFIRFKTNNFYICYILFFGIETSGSLWPWPWPWCLDPNLFDVHFQCKMVFSDLLGQWKYLPGQNKLTTIVVREQWPAKATSPLDYGHNNN